MSSPAQAAGGHEQQQQQDEEEQQERGRGRGRERELPSAADGDGAEEADAGALALGASLLTLCSVADATMSEALERANDDAEVGPARPHGGAEPPATNAAVVWCGELRAALLLLARDGGLSPCFPG